MVSKDYNLLDAVRVQIIESMHSSLEILGENSADFLMPGKMLRTRLAARLMEAGACICEQDTIVGACSAVELVHTASLFHDDSIDEAETRRRKPTLWKAKGRTIAILAGDLLICEAMELMILPCQNANLIPFVKKVKNVVEAEARHELQRGNDLPEKGDFLKIARGKTGSLFSFVAEVCGGSDLEMRRLFSEAGYAIGTAYQLLDDILDIEGREQDAGKTLGTDIGRGKKTMPQFDTPDYKNTRQTLRELFAYVSALFPKDSPVSLGLTKFIREDILPLFKGLNINLEVLFL